MCHTFGYNTKYCLMNYSLVYEDLKFIEGIGKNSNEILNKHVSEQVNLNKVAFYKINPKFTSPIIHKLPQYIYYFLQ